MRGPGPAPVKGLSSTPMFQSCEAWLGVGWNCAAVFGMWESLSQRQVKASSLRCATVERVSWQVL